jgi:hypothetical protein
MKVPSLYVESLSTSLKKLSETTAFFAPQVLAHNVLFIELRIDNPNKGEIMETLLIVIVVLFLLGGGGWGYSRWRR